MKNGITITEIKPRPWKDWEWGGAFGNNWFGRQRTNASCAGGPDGLGRGAFRISPNHGHPHDLHSPRTRAAMPRMPIRRLTVLALLALALTACSHAHPRNPMAQQVPSTNHGTRQPIPMMIQLTHFEQEPESHVLLPNDNRPQ